jgi:hypothetical protein
MRRVEQRSGPHNYTWHTSKARKVYDGIYLTCSRNYFILLFRPKAIHDLSPAQVEGDRMARRAADTITRMTEDLIAVGTLRYVQMHM